MPRSSRREGSGFAVARADALARLVAALLAKDRTEERQAMVELDEQQRMGRSPCGGDQLRTRITSLVSRAFGSVRSARALSKGEAGDVEVVLGSGAAERIEIKAQLDKDRVSHLTQSDWIRGECDGLRWLLRNVPAFRRRLSARNQAALGSDPDDLQGWDFRNLWLSDLAALTSQPLRSRFAVRRPSDLGLFLERKHLLHLCGERDSIRRLTDIPPLRAAVDGVQDVQFELKDNKVSECAVQVFVGGSGPVFTYHIYPHDYVAGQGLCGRHKLHGAIL
jgi:hypothetical protein